MSADANAAQGCDYCGLPLPAAWWGAAAHSAAVPEYCCYGCRIAAGLTHERGAQAEAIVTLARLGLAVFLTVNVTVFTMILWTDDVYGAAAASDVRLAAPLADLCRYLGLIFSLPVLWLLGGPVARDAWHAVRAGRPNTDLLLVQGVIAAYVYSAVSVFRGAGHVYFEVGCAVLVAVTLGRWLEATGKLQAGAALDRLAKLLPDQVRVVRHGHEATMPREQLAIGDTLRTAAGERIAADGRIVRGMASVDEQVLTGESQPRVREPGDPVLGGTHNLDGDLWIEVTADPAQGTLQRLIDAVQRARLAKGRYQRLADRVSGWMMPVVTLIAVATLVSHGWMSGWDHGLMSALAVLLIACPCALGIATPMAVWTAIGAAASRQVLFANADALERLAKVGACAFDKTGTLTTGQCRVSQVTLDDSQPASDALSIAATLAAASQHGLSRAVAEYLAEQGYEPLPGSEVRTHAGRGLSAELPGMDTRVVLGSVRWMDEFGLAMPPRIAQAVARGQAAGVPLACLGYAGKVRAVFAFREALRPEAAAAVGDLQRAGIAVQVLTGDHTGSAKGIAKQLSAYPGDCPNFASAAKQNGTVPFSLAGDCPEFAQSSEQIRTVPFAPVAPSHIEVRAELLPEDKVQAIAALRRQFGAVAMIGDGINDAPALATADVGISMGTGADVSRDGADVCLLANDLARVPWAIHLARRTVRVVRQNLFWAFAYNLAGIVLAATGTLNPIWAALAMIGSSVLVVGNSLRLAAFADQNHDRAVVSSDAERPYSLARSPEYAA